ncbi:probable muscarinic acetylcholine receptor gar-1 isoform X2 [Homarus americanus]|uniref:probable muscarinic acetylcholine receptor gar-1 isoform X2 n=1 Tax=Homarus americanus TaxID=6706 RepID=UPI001C48D06E|nr:probable muscarinic acetylcholine receptor gar-1 isoform X2 [Homarus americanus]
MTSEEITENDSLNYGDVGVTVVNHPLVLSYCRGVNSTIKYHINDICDGRMSLPLMIAMLVLGFVTFFVNLGVLIRTIKILRSGHDNKPAFYFIGNLALSDLAIGLYVIIAFLLHVTDMSDLWQQSTCMVQIAVSVTACQETIFTITLIAVDKYLYICHGLRYSFLVTSTRVYLALGISWVFSLLIGTLPAMGMHGTWEEACHRCVFAQIVSTDFTIIFFITSVVVPFAVVVTLYSMLLVLALKMHKARYGGSYTGDEKARSSNFRLSFMSKRSKSSKSSNSSKVTVSTTVSSSSAVSQTKVNRRKARKKEMAEYKAKLPGITEKDASAKLIRYKLQDDQDHEKKPPTPDGEITEKLIRDQLSQEAGVAEDSLQTLPLRGSTTCQGDDDAAPVESEHSSRQDNLDSDGAEADDQAREKVEESKCGDGEEDRSHVSVMVDERGVESQGNSDTVSGTGNMNTIRVSGEIVLPGREGNNSTIINKTQDVSVRVTHKNNDIEDADAYQVVRPYQEIIYDSDDDSPGSPTDEAVDQCETLPPPTTRSWLPTRYFNRVVTDTRDKMLFLKKCRAVKTVFLIIGSFSATYVPFVVGTLVYRVGTEKRVCLLHVLNTLLFCAVVANSLANPLIYAYGYREFRLKTKKFKGIFAREKPHKFK